MQFSQFKNLPHYLLIIVVIFLSGQVFADQNKRKKPKVKILENTSYEECLYSGNVAIEVKYKKRHFADNAETGHIILKTTQDGINYFKLLSKEVEAGRGSTILTFDAGECTRDIKVKIR